MNRQSTATAGPRVTLPPLAWAALGVLAFSFTFPATVLALRGFDPYLVGAGRSVIAALIAAGCLLTVRAPLPKREDLPGLIAVAVGCGIGFGLLSALALRHTTSTHAAVIVGLLPATTAIVAVLRTGDRPRWPFWATSGTGTAAVVAYALSRGGGGLHAADLLLLVALAVGAVGYAEGGRLARTIPGWQVIAWGVIFALPASLPVTIVALARATAHPTAVASVGFAYVGGFSMFLGFFAWYRGLAEAGIAKASQLQLAQPLLTIAWSVPLLGETVGAPALLTGVVVAACVLVTQRTRGTPLPADQPTPPPTNPDIVHA
ncbi:MAG: DMT family transporter [Actinomycetota bacterium]|nr:DMT family transporter [Actinomycetota bacterium]